MKKGILWLLLLLFPTNGKTQPIDVSIETISFDSIRAIPVDEIIGNIEQSNILFLQAEKEAKRSNDSLALAYISKKLSTIYIYQEKRDLAAKYILQAIRIYEEKNDFTNAGVCYADWGFSMRKRDLKKGESYMKKGIKLQENSGNLSEIAPAYDNFGVLQFEKNNIDSALYFHHKSLSIKKIMKDTFGIPFTYCHIATVHFNSNHFDQAKNYLDSAFQIRVQQNDNYGITDTYIYYGDLYYAKKEYSKAIDYLDKGYDLATIHQYPLLQKYCVDFITKSYAANKDYKNAFKFSSKYQSIKDSLMTKERAKNIADLEVGFETEKKEFQIAQQKEVIEKNRLIIKTRSLYATILGLGVLILGVLLYFVYYRNRLKKKQLLRELELQESLATIKTQHRLQEQRLQISRDLHDNIGSQLTFIISSVENLKFLSKSNDIIKDKLQYISNFTSSTIHELRDTIWAMNRNEIAVDDLESRIDNYIQKAKLAVDHIKISFNKPTENDIKFTAFEGMNIFRIIQESINNSIKYAKPTEIVVDFSEKTGILMIQITDNGTGFDIKEIKRGNGLSNMQKRIEEIGGKMFIHSQIGSGTNICLELKK